MVKKFKPIFDSLTKNKKIVPADAYMPNKLKLPESLQKEVNIFEKAQSLLVQYHYLRFLLPR